MKSPISAHHVDSTGSLGRSDTLTKRLEELHAQVLSDHPLIDRIACAIYDSTSDLLKTFFNSTRKGTPLSGYEFPLSKSPWLQQLAKSHKSRLIYDIDKAIDSDSEHTRWLKQQGYQSSLTVPMYSAEHFLGFLFFNSQKKSVFDESTQRDLMLFANLIILSIDAELTTIKAILATARAMREFADLRDFETGKHLDRMGQISHLIARDLQPKYQLSDETVEHIFMFAPLHDIGKIGVPDNILLKPGRLNDEERSAMETHVEKGILLIDNVLEDYGLDEHPDSSTMRNIIAYHHEMLDGSGYPHQLQGSDIPIESRIVTVADIFDALTSERPYKRPWTIEDALQELQRMAAAGKLDKDCVAALVRHQARAAEIVTKLKD